MIYVVPFAILVYCFDKMKYFASSIIIVFHACVNKIVTRKMFIELVEYVAVIEFLKFEDNVCALGQH